MLNLKERNKYHASLMLKDLRETAMEKNSKKNYIVADFGASNGRVCIGTYYGNKFEIPNTAQI